MKIDWTSQEDAKIVELRKKHVSWSTIRKTMNHIWRQQAGESVSAEQRFTKYCIIQRWVTALHNHEFSNWSHWTQEIQEQVLDRYAQIGADMQIIQHGLQLGEWNCSPCIRAFISKVLRIAFTSIETSVINNCENLPQIDEQAKLKMISLMTLHADNKFSHITRTLRRNLVDYMKCKMKDGEIDLEDQHKLYLLICRVYQKVEFMLKGRQHKHNYQYYRFSNIEVVRIVELFIQNQYNCLRTKRALIRQFGVTERFGVSTIKAKVVTIVAIGIKSIQKQLQKIGLTLDIQPTIANSYFLMAADKIHHEMTPKLMMIGLGTATIDSEAELIRMKQYFVNALGRDHTGVYHKRHAINDDDQD